MSFGLALTKVAGLVIGEYCVCVRREKVRKTERVGERVRECFSCLPLELRELVIVYVYNHNSLATYYFHT